VPFRPCKAHLRCQAPTVAQADSMLSETLHHFARKRQKNGTAAH